MSEEVEKQVEEVEEPVLDGEFQIEPVAEELADTEDAGPRVITLEKVNKPFRDRVDIEFDTLYYGNELSCGLVEVRKRTPRDMTLKKWNDRVMWYEGNMIIDGEGRKIAYHVLHEPSPHELFPEYFYPTTQWNISRPLLDEQDNVPGWKRMVAMKAIQGQEPEPFRVIMPGLATTTVNAFHFVIVNRRYAPIEGSNKRKIDGVFVLSPPASGTYIRSYRDAIKLMHGSPVGMTRQRAGSDSVAIVA